MANTKMFVLLCDKVASYKLKKKKEKRLYEKI